MTNLWEEISNIIFHSVPFKNSYTIDMHTEVVNNIVKTIEKRLDYYIEEADGKEEEVDLLNIMKEELLK